MIPLAVPYTPPMVRVRGIAFIGAVQFVKDAYGPEAHERVVEALPAEAPRHVRGPPPRRRLEAARRRSSSTPAPRASCSLRRTRRSTHGSASARARRAEPGRLPPDGGGHAHGDPPGLRPLALALRHRADVADRRTARAARSRGSATSPRHPRSARPTARPSRACSSQRDARRAHPAARVRARRRSGLRVGSDGLGSGGRPARQRAAALAPSAGGRAVCGEPRRETDAAPAPLLVPDHDVVEQAVGGGHDEQREQRGDEHAADEGERPSAAAARRPGPMARAGGMAPGDGGDRGHEDGPQAHRAGLEQRLVALDALARGSGW